jgi:molybdopterin molybdotransferase
MSPSLLSYEEAASHVRAYAEAILSDTPPAAERVKLADAQGRILAGPVVSDIDQPPFPRSTRDGFACRAVEASSHVALTVTGATRAGDAPAGALAANSAWEIMTGASVPAGADVVMMLEHVESASGSVRLLAPRTLEVGENVVPRGAEARAGQTLLVPGAQINAAQIALAATCGYSELDVYLRPRVAILCTGDELVPVDAKPGPGQIRNSNGSMLATLVAAAGGDPWILPPAADNAEALNAAIKQAREADLLLITGGVSAGKFDLVEPALERFGATFQFTGIRMQPGKPTVFGEMPARSGARRTALPLLGLPGNPISSAVTFLLYAAPVLAALAGCRGTVPRFATARLKADVRHAPGLTRFLPATCTFGAGAEWPLVELVPWKGSGDIAAFARSNCFLVLPEDKEHFTAGTEARILLGACY